MLLSFSDKRLTNTFRTAYQTLQFMLLFNNLYFTNGFDNNFTIIIIIFGVPHFSNMKFENFEPAGTFCLIMHLYAWCVKTSDLLTGDMDIAIVDK